MIRCPSATRQSTQRRSVSSGAWTTRARLSVDALDRLAGGCSLEPPAGRAPARSLAPFPEELADLVEDRRGDAALVGPWRRARSPFVGDERHLVRRALSKPMSSRETSFQTTRSTRLAPELLAGTGEPVSAVLGREADQNLAVAAPLAERAEDVGGRLERDLPRLVVLRALGAVGVRPGGSRTTAAAMSTRSAPSARASASRSRSAAVGVCTTSTPTGGGTARFAASSVTSAPRLLASAARATPMRPELAVADDSGRRRAARACRRR